jgi:hypothetical protein
MIITLPEKMSKEKVDVLKVPSRSILVTTATALLMKITIISRISVIITLHREDEQGKGRRAQGEEFAIASLSATPRR